MALTNSLLKYFPAIAPDSTFMKVVPSGSYTAGGDTLNISPSALTDPNGKGLIGYPDAGILPGVVPFVTAIVGMTSSYVGMYANVVPGTTQATYKLQMFLPGGTEVSAGAYAAGLLTGYFEICVVW
jgi:hypothetical protein